MSHDLAPTLVALGGGEPLADVTGKSLLPLLRGLRTDWRTAFLYEYNYEPQFPYTPNVRGVRTDRWKLIRYPQGDGSPDRFTAELYDLAADPHELRNLIDDPAHAATRRSSSAASTRSHAKPAPTTCPCTPASSTCGRRTESVGKELQELHESQGLKS